MFCAQDTSWPWHGTHSRLAETVTRSEPGCLILIGWTAGLYEGKELLLCGFHSGNVAQSLSSPMALPVWNVCSAFQLASGRNSTRITVQDDSSGHQLNVNSNCMWFISKDTFLSNKVDRPPLVHCLEISEEWDQLVDQTKLNFSLQINYCETNP